MNGLKGGLADCSEAARDCKEPARSLSSGRLPTSISLEAERQRNVIAKSRSCKITAAPRVALCPSMVYFSRHST